MEYINNIQLLGKNTSKILEKLGLIREEHENKIENNWNIVSYELSNHIKIEEIFQKIKDSLTKIIDNSSYSDDIFSFTIIYSLDELLNEKKNINNLLNKILENLTSFFYFPFFIFLVKNESDKSEFNKWIEKNMKVDKRNISCFISPLNNDINEQNANVGLIKKKIFRIFSYYFELGDNFKINGIQYKLYKEPEEQLFPINILLLGKTQVGKSTFINTFLKEKKAKEGGEGSSVSQKQISYHIDGIPLVINDIEGFTGEESIKKVINKIEIMQKKLGENELNLVIYIIDYNGEKTSTFFNDNEYPIFKQLTKKFDDTHFLFVCTKSKEDNNEIVLEKIKKAFFKMIQKGLKDKSEKENIINALNYMYYCIKKDISYDEMNNNKINKDLFNQMNFFEKLNLKFEIYKEADKNREMINTILKKDETLIFVNLKIDKEHKSTFGMNKVATKIMESFKNIQKENMKFINNILKSNSEKINSLDDTIKSLEERLNENKDINDYINDNDGIEMKNFYENESLLNKSFNEKLKLEEVNQSYIELLNAIKKKKFEKAKEKAENLKKEYINSVKKELIGYKIGGWLSGVIPLADIIIQHYIKKKARIKIANKFKDELVDLDKVNIKNKELSKEEKDNIKDIKHKSNDIASDIFKTIARIGTVGFNIVAKTASIGIAGVGCIIGIFTGGLVMNYDINSYLEFYGNRLICRLLVNLSFEEIEDYLKNNF